MTVSSICSGSTTDEGLENAEQSLAEHPEKKARDGWSMWNLRKEFVDLSFSRRICSVATDGVRQALTVPAGMEGGPSSDLRAAFRSCKAKRGHDHWRMIARELHKYGWIKCYVYEGSKQLPIPDFGNASHVTDHSSQMPCCDFTLACLHVNVVYRKVCAVSHVVAIYLLALLHQACSSGC